MSMLFASLVNAQSIQNSLTGCRVIKDSQQRLKCYDHIGTVNTTEVEQPIAALNSKQKLPPLLADLEEPRVFIARGSLDFLNQNLNAILLGIGTRVKLKTFDISNKFDDIDFNVIGMIKSQFDVSQLSTRNNRGGALINTDFMVGGELVKQFDAGSLRFKYAHRSTHLGDEFLIDNPFYLENRVNLSYETVDLLGYHQFNRWGAYAGGSLVVRSEPGSLGKYQVQLGTQYRGQKWHGMIPLLGVDLKSWEAQDWNTNTSLKFGFEFSGFLDQPLQVMLEYYDGKSPYGQFLTDDLRFVGLSINHYW